MNQWVFVYVEGQGQWAFIPGSISNLLDDAWVDAMLMKYITSRKYLLLQSGHY